jgi:hypothetical protein
MQKFDYKKLLIAYLKLIGEYEGACYATKLVEGDYDLTQEEVDELKSLEKQY